MRRFALAAIAAIAFVLPAPAQSTDIDGLLAQLPGVVARYDSKSDLGGVIALENLTLAKKNGDGSADEANKVFIKHAELTGLDGDAILSIFDANRYGAEADQTFKTLVSHLDLKEVSLIVDGKQVISIAGWTVSDWAMKQFWFKPGGADFKAQFASEKEMAAKIIGNLVDSTKIGPSVATGIHFEFDSSAMAAAMMPPGTPMPPAAGPAVYDYAEVTGEGVDRGKWGKLTFKGISGTAPMPPMGSMELSLQDGYWDGIDVSKVLPFMMKGEVPPTEREGLISIGASCANNYNVKIPGIGTMNFPSICTEAVPFVWLIPQHFKADVAGTFTPAPAGEFMAPPSIAKHFTGPMDIGILVETTYDPDAGTGALTHYAIKLGGFGSVDFSVTGGGLELAGLLMLPETYQQTLSLNAARVEVVDEGGLQKFLEMGADMANERAGGQGTPVTADQLKQQAKMGLDMASGMLAGSAEGAALIQAIKDFIDNGGKLTVQANPPAPLKAADFATLAGKPPAEMLAILGISAQHE
ncbi:hypothetical protein sos41_37650 [Alphaproteobacteria bacterium SO-S41]|nr:hypothetical protein sos41_37650 [Alphaproteobacteria bacterium SO-S41]